MQLEFILILLTISFFLLVLAFLLDKICGHYIEKNNLKISASSYVLRQKLILLATQGIILSMAEIFISPFFNTSIYEIWLIIPNWKWVALFLYIILQLFHSLSNAVSFKNSLYLNRVKRESVYPKQHFEYMLISSKANLVVLEHKLELLKGLSPIPLAILLLGELFNPSFSLTAQMSRWTFISVTAFICIYLYQFFITWYHYKNTKLGICEIEQKIFDIEHPDHTKDKNESQNIAPLPDTNA